MLAIDPGEKVGWAAGRIDGAGRLEVVDHGITSLWPFADRLAGDLVRHDPQFDIVVYERWRLAAYAAKEQIGSDMQTSQLIGVIRFLARRADVKLVSQDPKDQVIGERCAPHSVTAILDTLPKAHDESHDGSALKHLAYYWYRNYFDPTQEPA